MTRSGRSAGMAPAALSLYQTSNPVPLFQLKMAAKIF